jgi:Lipocalin-like domain
MNRDQLVGTWKVLTLKTTSGGKVSYPLGNRPAGFVSITPTRLWLLFVDPARETPVSSTLTERDAVAAMKSHVGWTGKYTVGDQTAEALTLTARVDTASSEAINGADRVYFMRLDGEKLTMRSPDTIVPMTGLSSVVEIELSRAD